MLIFNNVTLILKKDNRPLIKNFNFTLHNDDKMAIIGEEGNGKSTLLKAIVDRDIIKSYVDFRGEILHKDDKIGYLEQTLSHNWDFVTVMDYFLKENPQSEINFDNYDNVSTIYELFSKFNLNTDLIENEHYIGTLSGGEKVKLQLIKLLINNPDILLLDEPTNDLDINTLKWLENFIINSTIPIMFVSHDETLLENCATGVLHLEQSKKKSDAKYTVERIGYAQYIEKRFNLISKQEQVARKQRAEYREQMNDFNQIYDKVRREQNIITRSDPHGAALLKKKMKSLKSQERRYEREKDDFVDIPDVEDAIIIKNTEIDKIPSGKTVLEFYLEELSINNNIFSKNISLNVTGPEHIVIVGNNGIGKTTLLKIIYNQLKSRDDIKVGVMPQNYEEMIDLDKTPLDFLSDGSKEKDTLARTYMGSLKFTKEEMESKIGDLSGGQRAKILILHLILEKYNVLVLDEPTRNLSPLSNPVIKKLLSSYSGAIISISHDRKYIREVCDKIYELTSDGLFLRSSYYADDISKAL